MGGVILILDKVDFNIKTFIRDKEGHCIMIKFSVQEEAIRIINIYSRNIGTPQYMRQMLTAIKREINRNTIIVGDFNTPRRRMDSSFRQKINKNHKP